MFLRLAKGREVPVAALIPNLLTTLALSCGLASIHFSIRAAITRVQLENPEHAANLPTPLHLWEWALAAILFSAIFDALDGRAARMLHVTSKFGTVLDSLSDFVSFGVAPAIILHQWTLSGYINDSGPSARWHHTLGLIPVVTFALCSGMRLARFTAATYAPKPGPPSNFFVGLPTPAAAGLVLVPAMIDASHSISWQPPLWGIVAYTLLIAFLMISRVPMFALKRLRVGRYFVAPLLALVGIGVVMMFNDTWATLSVVALLYLLSIPWSMVRKRGEAASQPPVAAV